MEGKGWHPEGLGQAGELGRCEPREVQQVHSPAPGSGQFQTQIQAGREWIESSSEEKDRGYCLMRSSVTQLCVLTAQEPTMGSRWEGNSALLR